MVANEEVLNVNAKEIEIRVGCYVINRKKSRMIDSLKKGERMCWSVCIVNKTDLAK